MTHYPKRYFIFYGRTSYIVGAPWKLQCIGPRIPSDGPGDSGCVWDVSYHQAPAESCRSPVSWRSERRPVCPPHSVFWCSPRCSEGNECVGHTETRYCDCPANTHQQSSAHTAAVLNYTSCSSPLFSKLHYSNSCESPATFIHSLTWGGFLETVVSANSESLMITFAPSFQV